ncbi:hypothetical protein FO519_008092 [Halicephalobus sp. NKZ332]|nr:hypothetical protein FO519_008092 [Halicephalobus sp. NKZ332]
MKFLLFTTLVGVTVAVVLLGTEPKGLACTLCQDFVKDMETELENDEGSIEDKANRVCDKLTKNSTLLDPLCKSLIDKEIEKIVAGIENNDPPLKVCQDIKWC